MCSKGNEKDYKG